MPGRMEGTKETPTGPQHQAEPANKRHTLAGLPRPCH